MTDSNEEEMGLKDLSKSSSLESNFKLITTTSGVRVSQACDRCRIKKIKCDGQRPCHNCSKINFECKTSDKLTRRAFPKGYTENLEKKLKELQEENEKLKMKLGDSVRLDSRSTEDRKLPYHGNSPKQEVRNQNISEGVGRSSLGQATNSNFAIDQIFNLNNQGVIIGNDNLNFESQFNHLLINLNMPFLKISNSHNYLLNDPNVYLYHSSCSTYNDLSNRDTDIVFNPLTATNVQHDDELMGLSKIGNRAFPGDIYDLFIKLVNNFKRVFRSRSELNNQISEYFLNYNTFIPIFDYNEFIKSHEAFHTMYPFLFTYGDATINGFNMSSNDYFIVNQYFPIVVQLYAMAMMIDPTVNLNLVLNHRDPHYVLADGMEDLSQGDFLIRSLYDFLPYFNLFHVSTSQLQTLMLVLYYSLITNNKEKSLVLLSLINSFIGILGINLNSKNLFFNDLSLNLQQKRDRVKLFWSFKVLLKCFNLKFGFKPSINTTVINPVTIERYFELTPEKLSQLLESSSGETDELFRTLISPSVEFLTLLNVIIPSSFSPNYYQYLKNGRDHNPLQTHRKHHPHQLDWILNDGDGDGNDGNLNYNYTQFLAIDKNLVDWRDSLKRKVINLIPLNSQMKLPIISNITSSNLYFNILDHSHSQYGITPEGVVRYLETGLPDIHTASELIKIQLTFHYLLIRSSNYLNFVIDRELTQEYYSKISSISTEVLVYFLLVFDHVGEATEIWEPDHSVNKAVVNPVVLNSLGLDVDDEGFIINDFSVKRRKTDSNASSKRGKRKIPKSLYNGMLNGLSLTVINFKKSILLQILYLLVCQLKNAKKGIAISYDIVRIINSSIDLFIKIFINYRGESGNSVKKSKEDIIFSKLLSDQFKDDILKEPSNDSDYEVDERDHSHGSYNSLDWDAEDMDEDLKYLKILKFVSYKINKIYEDSRSPSLSERPSMGMPGSKHEAIGNNHAYNKKNYSQNSYNTKPLTLPKYEFLVGDNFSEPSMNSLHNESLNGKISRHDDSLSKKDKLAITDLVNLKRGHKNEVGTHNSWSYQQDHAHDNIPH